MPTNDEHLYLQAIQEVEGDSRQDGLWAKAITLEKGDAEQAKYRYVQLRVEQLQKAPEVAELPPPYPDGENISGARSDQSTSNNLLEKGAPVYSFASSPSDLTRYTIFALWALVVISGIAIISDVMQLNLLDSPWTVSMEEAQSNDTRVRIVNILHFGIIIISSVMMVVWRYRANENCHGFGAQNMQFTPGWAAGSNFVPIMNLFRPYQVMQEIWKVSTDPSAWRNQAGGLLVKWWWAACVVSMLLCQAYSRTALKNLSRTEGVRELQETTVASVFTSGAIVVSAFMTIWLVNTIYKKQQQITLKCVGTSQLPPLEKDSAPVGSGDFPIESNIIKKVSKFLSCPSCGERVGYTDKQITEIEKTGTWRQPCRKCGTSFDVRGNI